MKKLSETYKEIGVAFSFPVEIKDAKGKQTYYENSKGFWARYEYDENGNRTYYENSNGFWARYKYNKNGNLIYCEDSSGFWYRYKLDDQEEI